jgi:hypothetical protein
LPTPELQLFAIAVEGKPVSSFCRWLIVSSAIAQESSTAIAICSRSADRGGRVAPPAADPSQAILRVEIGDDLGSIFLDAFGNGRRPDD